MGSTAATISTEYELTSEDVRRYSVYLAIESRLGRRSLATARTIVISVLVGLMALGPLTSPPRSPLSLIAYVVFLGVVVAIVGWQSPLLGRRLLAERSAEAMIRQSDPLGHWRVVANGEGLDFWHAKGAGCIPWGTVQRVETHDGSVYLFLGPTTAHVIPSSAFGSHRDLDAFATFSEDQVRRAQRVA